MHRGALRSKVCSCLPLQAISAVTIFDRPDGCLSSIRRPYLAEDRFHVNLDRSLGNGACPGDHLVGMPLQQACEDLLFAVREAMKISNWRSAVNGTIPHLLDHNLRTQWPSECQMAVGA